MCWGQGWRKCSLWMCAHCSDDKTKYPASVLILHGSVSVGTEAVHELFNVIVFLSVGG
jgi:hypothetical protein